MHTLRRSKKGFLTCRPALGLCHHLLTAEAVHCARPFAVSSVSVPSCSIPLRFLTSRSGELRDYANLARRRHELLPGGCHPFPPLPGLPGKIRFDGFVPGIGTVRGSSRRRGDKTACCKEPRAVFPSPLILECNEKGTQSACQFRRRRCIRFGCRAIL